MADQPAVAQELPDRALGRQPVLSPEQFQLFVDSLSDCALFMLDPRGIVSSWNVGAERLKGYRAGEIIGKHFSCFYPPEDVAAGQPQLALRHAAEDGRHAEEGWRLRRDGSRFYADLLIFPMRDARGELVGFVKLTRDMTQRRSARSRLQTQAEILELANDAIVVRDLADRVTYWNRAAERLYGWTPAEALGRVTHELLQTRFPDALGHISEVIHTSGLWTGELDHTRKDGERLRVESRWAVHSDSEGRPMGIIEVNRDITERQRMSADLQATNQELQQALKAKDAFLAVMSHELRTPLNGIIGFSELLHSGLPGALNAKQSEYLADVLESGRLLLNLINDILDLSKIGAGKMTLELSDFSVADVIGQVCSGALPIANQKRVVIEQRLKASPACAHLDERRFRQVIWNLLSNAIKFSHPGGRVEVEVGSTDPKRFRVSVRDFGIGIAPEHMHRLFKTFEQLDNGLTRKYEGTGLGLALTRRLVEMHGGSIQATSEKGVGSVFSFELPITAEEHKST